MPADVASRLTTARKAAVAELDRARKVWSPTRLFRWQLFAGFAACAAVAVVAVVVALRTPTDEQLPALAVDREAEAVENLELLEDLEFLAWLEAADRDAG